MAGSGVARARVAATGNNGGVAQVLLERSFDASSLHDLRQQIRSRLATAGVGQDASETFTFAINEGLINAIMHGGGGGDLALLKINSRIVATVEDHRPTAPFDLPRHLPPATTMGGRGLWLVAQSCDEVRLEKGARGLRLVLELRLTPEPA
jgi:serine/threonine-protein kinase RsbW